MSHTTSWCFMVHSAIWEGPEPDTEPESERGEHVTDEEYQPR